MSDDNIYVVGYPRSGHNWLQRLLSDALGWPVQNWPDDTPEWWGPERKEGTPCIAKRHVLPQEQLTGRVVAVFRDPRDVAVSLMHYRGYPNLLSTLVDMIYTHDPARDLYGPYHDFVSEWWDAGSIYSTYEDMHKYKAVQLFDLIGKLGESANMGRCIHAWERQSIEAFRAAHPGRDEHGVRKGVVGGWRGCFHREDAKYIHQHLAVLMFRQGYITSDDWWGEVV